MRGKRKNRTLAGWPGASRLYSQPTQHKIYFLLEIDCTGGRQAAESTLLTDKPNYIHSIKNIR